MVSQLLDQAGRVSPTGAQPDGRPGRFFAALLRLRFAMIAIEAGTIGLLPVAVYYVFSVEPFSIRTAIDSFIYAGYSQHLSDLITRSGFPYFSVRFGLILPARAASAVFGPVPGYFIMRYGLAVLASGFLYLLARRHGVRAAGLVGCLVMLSSPIFLGALMTFYADTVGLPMLVVGLSCLLMPSRRPGVWYLIAGLAFGMAINANLFTAGLAVAAIGVSALMNLLRRDFRRLVGLILVPVGFLFVTGVGALYYREAYGLTNVFAPSWRFLISESKRTSQAFRAPTYAWLNFDLYVYIPLLILLAGAVMLAGRALARPTVAGQQSTLSRIRPLLKSPLLEAVALLAAGELFFGLVEFVLKGDELEYFFYASYLWAFAVVALTVIAVEVFRSGLIRPTAGAVIAGAATLIPLARRWLFPHLTVWAFPTVILMGILIGGLMLAARRRPVIGQAGLVSIVGCVAILGVSAPRDVPFSPGQINRADAHYEETIGYGNRTGLDMFEVSVQMIRALPQWSQDPGTIVFWYSGSENVLNLIQATYLWLPDTLQGSAPGLPVLSTKEINELKGRTPRRLVILGTSKMDIVAGRSGLSAAGIYPLAVEDRTLHSGVITVYMESLIFKPAPCDSTWRSTAFAWSDLPPKCT